MANIRDIAAKCGLSVSSVSKALNNYGDISADTRERVLKAAQELGYFPSSIARALKTNRTYNLGVLFMDDKKSGLKHNYFAAVLDSFKVQAEKLYYDITFINHNMRIGARTMSYLEHCKYRNVDGVCIACIDFNQPEVIELVKSDIPLVTIDHVFHNRTSVLSSNVLGMQQLVEYSAGMGHRKIAYVHGAKSSVTDQRLTSFRRTMQQLNLPLRQEYLVESEYQDAAATRRATRQLLQLSEPPTCILMPDDYAAIGGIEEIEAAGLRIPEDISVVGYDGIPLSQVIRPRLTTLQQDTERMGAEAALHLIEQIERPLTTIAETVTVNGTLLPGQSVRKI